VQQVTVFSTPAGATLVLDGKDVGRTPWTGEIAPGRHTAILKATGMTDTAKEFVLTSERAMDLDVALSAPAGSTPATPIPQPQKPEDPPPIPEAPKRGVAPWTFAALGVGVASIGASIGLEFARRSDESAAKADPTQVGYHDKLASMQTKQTAARAMAGVGAAA